MLRILGSHQRLCSGWTRREMLAVGGLAPLSLGLADWLQMQEYSAASTDRSGFGRAKRIILLYLMGAASQYETFDPKPEAPAEIRGEFGPTQTALPGLAICDRLPKLAQVADRVAVVRSMSHPHNNHSNVYTLTGRPAVDFGSETSPYDHRHWPFFGSMLQYLARRKDALAPISEIPNNIALPFPLSRRNFIQRGGPYGGFLGRTYDPVWTEFEGKATRSVMRDSAFGGAEFSVRDPYLGITPESRLSISRGGSLQPGMTLDRLDRRRNLLGQLDIAHRAADESMSGQSLDRFQQMAWSLITSKKVREALDVAREPMATRERYGMTLFGQATLAGRRLLEAGAPMVSVMWDEIDAINSAWDTHFRIFSRLGDELLPGLDGALSSLIVDLDERGMLDETLVLCLTEHGRSDKLIPRQHGPGRDHSSSVYSVLLAGGGIARGTVIGASDERGAAVKRDPVTPEDILATMYHLAGVDHTMTIPDRLERPAAIVAEGDVVQALLA